MSDLQKIKESVLAKAQQEGKETYQAAVLAQQQAFDQAYQEKMREKNAQRKHLLDREIQQMTRLEQQVDNQTRQANLKSRQDLINQLFKEAAAKMSSWSSQETGNFIQAVLKGFEGQDVTLVLSEQTKANLGETQLSKLLEANPSLTYDESGKLAQAGFVLRQGCVDYNFTYDQLVESLRETLSTDLAQQVFSN